MKHIAVELLTTTTNSAVIRLPGRAFPGVVLQGDSLAALYRCAEALYERCVHDRDGQQVVEAGVISEEETTCDLAREVIHLLARYVRVYEAALHAHDIPLPYSTDLGPRLPDEPPVEQS